MKFLNIVTTFLAMAVHASICDVAVIADRHFARAAGYIHGSDELKDFIRQKVGEAAVPFKDAFGLTINIATIQSVENPPVTDNHPQDFQTVANTVVQDPNRCFVIFLTGRKKLLYNGQPVLGISPIGVACNRFVLSAKYVDNDQIRNTMAHEMGHMLGARHDADTAKCKNDKGFIMSGIDKLEFSGCSIGAIAKKLPSYTCLR
jgi:hypothetical protein